MLEMLPSRLPSLTSLRAFAALFVFFYHLNSVGLLSFTPAKLGYTGVAFFFVLSGFLLAWTDRPGQSSGQFYMRRLARVYPSHIVMMLVVLCVPSREGQEAPLSVLLHVLLLQAWVPDFDYAYSINGVAWSLSCEMFFYALFPLILSSLRGRSVVALAGYGFGAFTLIGAFVVASTTMEAGSGLDALRYTNPLVRLPEFMLGVCAALALRKGWKPRLWVGLALACVAAAGIVLWPEKPAGDVWGCLVYLSIIVTFAHIDCTRPNRSIRAKALIYAGELSFAFYLVHQWVMLRAIEAYGISPATIAVSFTASIVLAVALHHGVELPANRAILARFASKSDAAGRQVP